MKVLLSKVPNKLTELLNEQLRCAKELLKLSRRQKEAILSDDMETITKVLFRKAKLIEEFKNIRKLYEREYHSKKNKSLKLTHFPQIDDLLKEIDAVLAELRVVEGESEETLSKKCTEIKDEIDQTKKSQSIIKKFNVRPKIFRSSGLIDGKA